MWRCLTRFHFGQIFDRRSRSHNSYVFAPPPPRLRDSRPRVVKQDTSSGGSVDTTKTCSDPQRVGMCSGERPTGTAKGKQPNTEALCHPPPPPPKGSTASVPRALSSQHFFPVRLGGHEACLCRQAPITPRPTRSVCTPCALRESYTSPPQVLNWDRQCIS